MKLFIKEFFNKFDEIRSFTNEKLSNQVFMSALDS